MKEDASSSLMKGLKAISNENRFKILEWILDPEAHFPPQKDGDLVEDGVCVAFITEKIGLKQPTVTSHMQVLAEAGLVTAQSIKTWVFYKPNRAAIDQLLTNMRETIKTS